VRDADVVLGNSLFVSETIERHFGIRAETIYDGVDVRSFYPQKGEGASPSEKLIVLYAGSLQVRKRVPLLIQQAARWPEVEFRLAGQGEEEVQCRRLVSELGCRNVAFLGHLSSHQLGIEMRRADVFAFPSVLEGHPQVLVQAAACGLPTVAMNVYRPDYVVQEKTGFLVESDADFAQRIDLLLTDAKLRRAFSAAAAEHARRFSWDQIAGQWADVFRRAADQRRRS
jgi:glycosyltransferase involved in cell wall biosynthesis